MKSLLLAVLPAFISLSSYANTVTPPRTDAEQFCLKQGGKLTLYSQRDARRQPTGLERTFCEFNNEGEGFKMIAPETLASEISTTAVHAFRHGTANMQPTNGFLTPAFVHCVQKLKGKYSNWSNKETNDESGTCSFDDGSEISDWALVYGASRLPILNSLIKFQEASGETNSRS